MKRDIRRSPRVWLAAGALFAAGCPSIPSDCGKNVREVTELSFKGPDRLVGGEGFYEQIVRIDKVDPEADATVCLLVRDQDWFLSPDDVLLKQFLGFPDQATESTVEFSLVTQYASALGVQAGLMVCGQGPVAYIDCSSEFEAEVYLQVVDADDGLTDIRTPIQRIRAE